MKRFQSLCSSAGVTLIEMLVGVAVLGVILAVATPSLSSFMERRRVVAAAGEVANMFAFARSEANVVDDTLNMHMEPVPDSVGKFSCIRISVFSVTDTCGCNRALDQVCSFGGGHLLREYVLPRNSVRFDASGNWGFSGAVVAFKRDRHFTDVKNVRVTVTGIRTGAKLRVEYNNVGRVRICSPDGNFSGYPTCG